MIDLLLLLMAIIWGTNYSIIKFAFAHVDPQAFNSARMAMTSVLFLLLIGFFRAWRVEPAGDVPARDSLDVAAAGALDDARRSRAKSGWVGGLRTPARITGRDLVELAALGLVGHFLYQYFFIGGLALTTVANSSLMLATTPVLIALIGAMFGLERVSARHWAGAVLSLVGIYIVVGRGVDIGGSGARGDVMMVAAVVCWAVYTLGSRRLISRHSPVGVTGVSMAIGTLVYVPVMWPHVRATDWASLGWSTWLAIVYSSVFALGVAYTIWYAAVRKIGSARTSVYSNVIPIVAMITAVIFLGEPLTLTNVVGAAAVLIGVGLTRGT